MPLPVLANPAAFNMVGKELSSYREVVKRVRDKQITIQNAVNAVVMNNGLNEMTKPLYKEYKASDKKLDKMLSNSLSVLNDPKRASIIGTALVMAARGAYHAAGWKKLGASNGYVAGIFVRTALVGGENPNDSPTKFIIDMLTPFVAGYIGGKIGMRMIKSPTDLAKILNNKLEETRNLAKVFISAAKSHSAIE